jgi:VIT1/CCC1 family predicted Fe2+/Mn2+ transporter
MRLGEHRQAAGAFAQLKKAPTQTTGPSDYQQKITLKTFVSSLFPDYGALIPVMPVMPVMMVMMVRIVSVVMSVMIVAIVMMVTMMITVPSCGWNRAAGYDRADNA